MEKPKAFEIAREIRISGEGQNTVARFSDFVKVYPAASMDAYLDAIFRFFRKYYAVKNSRHDESWVLYGIFYGDKRIGLDGAFWEISHETELGAAILKELVEKGEI